MALLFVKGRKMSKINVIDLFCGAGGLSKGLIDAGFNVLLGCDNDKDALHTFEINHNGALSINADLSSEKVLYEISESLNSKKVDVIVAGPPCQGFSLTGPRKFEDPRNKLYLAVISLVKMIRPKGFLIENVPGMATMYKGQVKNEIIKRLSRIGYNVKAKILCAADYGVPQIRKRLIIMGVRQDVGIPQFPNPVLEKESYITCREAIDDLPSRENGNLGNEVDNYIEKPHTSYQKKMRGKNNILYNHVASKHKQFVKDVISQVPEGGNYKDLPAGVGTSRNFHMAWTRLNGNAPARTVDTGHRNIFHYEYNRIPTVRENARLQSFPDNFIFTGSRTHQQMQVGNAVPPLLGYYLGKELKKIIRKEDIYIND